MTLDKYYIKNRKTAFLLIDLQEKLMPQIFEAEKMIRNTLALVELAKKVGIRVIATEQYPKGLGRTDERLIDKIDDVFEKTMFNALITEVENYIEDNELDTIIITGAESHICVYQTVRDLLNKGKKVFVITDCVSSYDLDKKTRGLATMEKMGAVLICAETLMYDLLKDAKNENFKGMMTSVKELRSL